MAQAHSRENSSHQMRVVLIGGTGDGKSATGNMVLGKHLFHSAFSARPVTRQCEVGLAERFGWQIRLIDTPGLVDGLSRSNESVLEKLAEFIFMSDPGPHAFMIVIRPNRCTPELQDTFSLIVRTFGEEILRYTAILFTRKDELDTESLSVDDFVARSPEWLKTLVWKVDRRYFAVSNRCSETEREQNSKVFIEMVERIITQNCGECYTISYYERAMAMRQGEERRQQQTSENNRRTSDNENKQKQKAEKDARKDVIYFRQTRLGRLAEWVIPERVMVFVAWIFRIIFQFIYPTD